MMSLSSGRYGSDVIEVAVGDEDRLDVDAERVNRLRQALGLVAGVDQQRTGGVA
jgi:hypothetical protein